MSRADIWMPLFVTDYLSDTSRLTTTDHGAYLLLLMEYWRHGPLPDNDADLAAIAKLSEKAWAKDIGPRIKRFFQRQDDGLLHQKRMDVERKKAADLSEKRRASAMQKGKKDDGSGGGTPAKDELLLSNRPANASAIESVLQAPLSRDTSHFTKERKKEPANAGAAGSLGVREVLWSRGLEDLRQMTGLGSAAARRLLGKLCRDAGDDCAKVLKALAEASDLRPGDPVAWITKALGGKPDKDAWKMRECERIAADHLRASDDVVDFFPRLPAA